MDNSTKRISEILPAVMRDITVRFHANKNPEQAAVLDEWLKRDEELRLEGKALLRQLDEEDDHGRRHRLHEQFIQTRQTRTRLNQECVAKLEQMQAAQTGVA